jgi:hypothetical protein
MYPSGYKKYALFARLNGGKPKINLARFAARYRFAGQLNNIELLNSSDSTTDSYLSAIRLALAYSALEALESELGKGSISIKSEKLALKIKNDRLLKFRTFVVQSSEPALRRRLENFFGNKNNFDLRPVVEALRHAMFHGYFNPSSSGITSKSARDFIDELGKLVFSVMDSHSKALFGELISKQAWLNTDSSSD